MKIQHVIKKIALHIDATNSPCNQNNFTLLETTNNLHLLICRVQGIFTGPQPLK
jgi:hypothetical protein